MGAVKNHYWDEINEAAEDYYEPDFEAYYESINKNVRDWYSHLIGEDYQGPLNDEISGMYWAWYTGDSSCAFGH